MQLYKFDYRQNRIYGNLLAEDNIVDLLSGDEKVRIVYDTEGFSGSNKDFGINYGLEGRKGFMHDDIEYLINPQNKIVSASPPHKPRANLFFDADKRDSFRTYKVEFQLIDEILGKFVRCGYRVIME